MSYVFVIGKMFCLLQYEIEMNMALKLQLMKFDTKQWISHIHPPKENQRINSLNDGYFYPHLWFT